MNTADMTAQEMMGKIAAGNGFIAALSGGFERPEACAELAKNRGIIASLSRALLNDLRHEMRAEEFNASLGQAIDDMYAASTKQAASV